MALQIRAILAILALFSLKGVTAGYQNWTELPGCAQTCLTQIVTASLTGCNELSLACFCDSDSATAGFDTCLKLDSSCDSDRVKTDAEDYQSSIFCNTSVDSGFRFIATNGNETTTLGLPSGGTEATISSNAVSVEETITASSADSSNSSSSSGNSLASASATTCSPTSTSSFGSSSQSGKPLALITSISTVVVELSSSTTAPSTPTAAVVVTTATVTAAARRNTSFGSSLLAKCVLGLTAIIFGWV